MNLTINIFSLLVALEFIYIMWLETFATSSKITGKVFNMEPDELHKPTVQLLFKNQGVYNGLISIGILYAIFISNHAHELLAMIMVYIIIVALYGSHSSGNISILFKQGSLAIVTIVLLMINALL